MKPSSSAPAAARSFARSAKEIGWAFLGIRKNAGTGRIGALQLVAVAFVAVVLLVLGLIAVVHWVVPG